MLKTLSIVVITCIWAFVGFATGAMLPIICSFVVDLALYFMGFKSEIYVFFWNWWYVFGVLGSIGFGFLSFRSRSSSETHGETTAAGLGNTAVVIKAIGVSITAAFSGFVLAVALFAAMVTPPSVDSGGTAMAIAPLAIVFAIVCGIASGAAVLVHGLKH